MAAVSADPPACWCTPNRGARESASEFQPTVGNPGRVEHMLQFVLAPSHLSVVKMMRQLQVIASMARPSPENLNGLWIPNEDRKKTNYYLNYYRIWAPWYL